MHLYIDKKYSLRCIANLLQLRKSTLHRWVHEYGSASARGRFSGRRTHLTSAVSQWLHAQLEGNPFRTCRSLSGQFYHDFKFSTSKSTVNRWIRNIGYTRKIPVHVYSSPELERKRQTWCDLHWLKFQTPCRLISIDETGFYIHCQPTKGYAPRGKRLILSKCPQVSRPRRLSVLMAVSRTKVLKWRN